MNQHSPGPWKIVVNGGRRGGVARVRAADGRWLCTFDHMTEPKEEAAANAALIETAPELLELAETNVRDHVPDPDYDAAVLALCERVGFGVVMTSAARQWRERDPRGAFTVGDCVLAVQSVLEKARGGNERPGDTGRDGEATAWPTLSRR